MNAAARTEYSHVEVRLGCEHFVTEKIRRDDRHADTMCPTFFKDWFGFGYVAIVENDICTSRRTSFGHS